MSLAVVVLAAGQGKRMHSSLPKVLHPLAGRPLLAHVLDAARALDPAQIVVVHGDGGEEVGALFKGAALTWVEQAEQLGTGHALAQAMPRIKPDAQALVLNGDVPLVRPETLKRLVHAANKGLAICTSDLTDAAGYGRVVRDARKRVRRIVEHKDATERELRIREWYAGFLAAPAERLARWLGRLKPANAQAEYYLTDVIGLAVSHVPDDALVLTEETFGPVLPVVKVRDADEAVDRANASQFGLGGGVFGKRRASELVARLRAGACGVNTVMFFYAHRRLPLGGVGASGFGTVHGPDGLRGFAHSKAVLRRRLSLGRYALDRLDPHPWFRAGVREGGEGFNPPAGRPPIGPLSSVNVTRSRMPRAAASISAGGCGPKDTWPVPPAGARTSATSRSRGSRRTAR